MTKADLVNEISKSTGVEKAQVQQIIESFMENIKESMINQNNVY
ncbi:MAG: HU family DNA-binding protein, partial [Alistipes sp.]|nr:HU family DNA-binding protein [Alistipes sp.]